MAGYDHSIVDLLRSTIRDAQDLVRGEIALAKAELRDEVRRVGAGVAMLAAAAVAALLAVVFLLTAAAWGLSAGLDWPVWAGFAAVGAAVAVAAAILLKMGRRGLNRARHMPLTVDTMKETIEWTRARMS